MSVPNTVTVAGEIRDIYGHLYEGAVVEVYLHNQMSHSESTIGNAVYKTFSNSYGKFSLDLVPSDVVDGNYYVFKIIKDTINTYRRVVTSVPSLQKFEDLQPYVPQALKTNYIGNVDAKIEQTIPTDVEGVFQANQFQGDGVTKVFQSPGQIFFVTVNGIVQSESIDYVKQPNDNIEFFSAPDEDSIIAIFYRL